MSASSPAAPRPSASRALVSALHALSARPAALVLLLLMRTLQGILTPIHNAVSALLPAVPFRLVWSPVYYALLLLLHAGCIRFILSVFVRGERPRLRTFFEPFAWGFRRGVLMAFAVGLLFMLTSAAPVPLTVLVTYALHLPLPLMPALIALFTVAGTLLLFNALAAYALSRGACGLRGLFTGLCAKCVPLLFLCLFFLLFSTLFTLLRALPGLLTLAQPDALPDLLRNAATFDVLSPLGALSYLVVSLFNSLQDAAFIFLYDPT